MDKTLTTTKEGYQIPLKEIYNGKISNSPKKIQIVINMIGVENIFSSNQIIIEAEEGMTCLEWFNSVYCERSNEDLKNICKIDDDYKWGWAEESEHDLEIKGNGSGIYDENNILKPNIIITDKLELNFEYYK